MAKRSRLHRTVFLLGSASFFNDISSEMIYPMLPVFLTQVLGAGTLQLGIIEGISESTAAFLKVFSGFWTDKIKRRKPFIFFGYFAAGISRSLIGLARLWPTVMVLRFFDRLGKGVRTSPRDALIADVTPEEERGRAYGMQRSMDHAGAVIGPLVAAGLLAWGGLSLRQVFLSAAVPAVIVMICLFLMGREGAQAPSAASLQTPLTSHVPIKRDFKLFLIAVFLFELGGSTDAFLLLRLTDVGVPASRVALLWSLLHVVKMSTTYWIGPLSDRWNRRNLLLAGWILYVLIYFVIGSTSSVGLTVGLFLLYGCYFGLTEPTERALISRWAGPHAQGRYFGFYHGIVGLAALPAGLLFGGFWKLWGPSSAFYMAAGFSTIACGVLVLGSRFMNNQATS